jgi:pilus assembly protein CpaF
LHANSVADVPARIEALCTAAGLTRDAAHSQLAAGVQVVVQLARRADGRRVLDSIGVVIRGADGLVAVLPAIRLRGSGWRDDEGRAALDEVLERRVRRGEQ